MWTDAGVPIHRCLPVRLLDVTENLLSEALIKHRVCFFKYSFGYSGVHVSSKDLSLLAIGKPLSERQLMS